MVEIGERVCFRTGKLDKTRKIEPRWTEGIFLGMSWRTGAAYIGRGEEVAMVHALRRVPQADRWRADLLSQIKGVPWERVPSKLEDNSEVKVIHVNRDNMPKPVITKEE